MSVIATASSAHQRTFDDQHYHETTWTPGEEPRRRCLRVITRLCRSEWHFTIAFEGSLHEDGRVRVAKAQRRQDLADLYACLDFDSLQLKNDTVTEILIKRAGDSTPPVYENDLAYPNRALPLTALPNLNSEYAHCHADLRFCVREDPRHVRYPALHPQLSTKDISEITKIQQLSSGVYEAEVICCNERVVFKGIDRPLYEPRDSQVLYQELENLRQVQGAYGIVGLVAAVVSQNPYQTIKDAKTPTVLRGILVDFHPNGTLENALKNASKYGAMIWHKWALQISQALHCLHQHGIRHMDLKPTNIVISAKFDAIIIDISGIGGTTREWLAPEMLDLLEPWSADGLSQVQNDIWALGQILMCMAQASFDKLENSPLLPIAKGMTTRIPSLRTGLPAAVAALSCIPSLAT